jgi:hypothetical protein
MKQQWMWDESPLDCSRRHFLNGGVDIPSLGEESIYDEFPGLDFLSGQCAGVKCWATTTAF